jgi:CheY-like chemotaxis protein
VGIDEVHRETIFHEFTRLGQVEADGLGLGLALVERITRLLGGKLEMHSIPGKGSRFSLLLPVYKGALPRRDAAVPDGVASGAALRLLVVDNDPLIVEATSAMLGAMGHQVSGAADVAGALTKAAGIDAALVDFQLDHGEDGLTLIAALRSHRPRLPAVLITAENGAAMRARAAAMQVRVLSKPVDPAAIAAFLQTVSVLEIET